MISQIRQSIFETNSSSTHVLSVSKMQLNPANLPASVTIDLFAQFGWEEETYYDTDSKVSYLYILAGDNEDKQKRIKALISALGIQVIEYNDEDHTHDPWDYGYIDHGSEAVGFLNELLDHPDLFYAFIFNPASFIETGNDNSDSFEKYESENEDGWIELDLNKVPGDYVYYKGN